VPGPSESGRVNGSETIVAKRAAARPRKKGGLGETTRFLLLLFVVAILLRSFIVAPFSIPSGSMLPRLMIGDYLFVGKWSYGYSRYSLPVAVPGWEGRFPGGAPERGDVAVFRYPGTDDDYVKRVIGLPGDRVQMRGGALWLNGLPVARVRVADYLMPISPNSPCRTIDPEALRIVEGDDGERYCAYARYRETLPGGRSYFVLDQVPDGPADDTPVFAVPAGHYFMVGDNRDDSQDSRFSRAAEGVGFLPEDYLVGEALITFFSTDGSAEWLKPWTWFGAARWDRIGETF
jgi:signal peptidase I